MLVKKFQPDISIEYNSYHLNRDGQFLWFIQTPEIIDNEKYILQKSGKRDLSESNSVCMAALEWGRGNFNCPGPDVSV